MRPFTVLLFLSLSHFLVDFMIGVWPVFKTMAGLDLAYAGMIYAVSSSLGEGMQVFFGNWSDRGWRQVLILGGMACTTLGAFFAFTTSYALLFVFFITLCFGSGAFHPSAVGLISRLTHNKKSFYITIFAAFGSLGMAFSQIVYSGVYGFFSGNTLILILPTLALILILRYKKVVKAPVNTSQSLSKPRFRVFIEFFKKASLRQLYFSQLCNQTVAWGLFFLLPDVLKSRGYDDWIVYGGGHMTYVLGSVFFLIPSGLLADRFSSRSVILGATLIGFMLFYTFLSFPELSDEATLALLFAMGATISVVNPVSVAFGNKLAPEHPGMISAFLMGCVWFVSEFIGPGGGGLLTKLFVEDAPARALMILGSAFVGGLFFALKLPVDAPAVVPNFAHETEKS